MSDTGSEPRCPNPFCDGEGNIDVSPDINGKAWRLGACTVGPHEVRVVEQQSGPTIGGDYGGDGDTDEHSRAGGRGAGGRPGVPGRDDGPAQDDGGSAGLAGRVREVGERQSGTEGERRCTCKPRISGAPKTHASYCALFAGSPERQPDDEGDLTATLDGDDDPEKAAMEQRINDLTADLVACRAERERTVAAVVEELRERANEEPMPYGPNWWG